MMKYLGLVFCLAGLLSISSRAQQFGATPAAYPWKQINTARFRLIFPPDYATQANVVAAVLDTLSRATLSTIGSTVKKVNIVFRSQTTVSNGYVQLAPFRSEFELTADQNSFELGSLPWPKQLAIHEYRHVQQYNNFRVGLSRAFYYLLGQSGQELANALAIPNWFWEGDAVFQETMVSDQGRGRLPFFFNSYRALWAADKSYSWMKLRNGSLRDDIPDHYPLGYMLTAYGRKAYGDDFWKKVSHDAARFRGLFYPWQKAVARYSGMSFTRFRDTALHYFRNTATLDNMASPADRFAQQHRHFVADEEYPQFIDPTRIIYVRTSFEQVHRFVVRDLVRNKDSVVGIRAVSLDNQFSYRNHRLVYAAYEPDLRWGWRDYGVIRVLDLLTGRDMRLTTQKKYFSPDISPDGRQIVAVVQAENGSCSLDLLDATTGKRLASIPNPDSLYFTYPRFLDDQSLVSAVRNPEGETALARIRIKDGHTICLTPFSISPVGFPSAAGDTVFYTATAANRDRVFCVVGDKIFEAEGTGLQSAGGNYQWQSAGEKYCWTTYTAVGYKMMVSPAPAIRWIPVKAPEGLETQGIPFHAAGADVLGSIRPAQYTPEKYSSAHGLINFHSWRPYVEDPDYTLALVSDNVLNTFETELYGTYNRNEASTKVGVDGIYGGFFPWIDGGVSYTFNRNALFHGQPVYWNELNAQAGFSIPLNLSRGKSFTNLNAGGDLVYSDRYFQGKYVDSFSRSDLLYIDPYLVFTHQSQQARKQINPSWAQSVSFRWNQSVNLAGSWQALASGYFYFPGLTATHSLLLTAAFQQRDTLDQVRYTNSFPFSRGYTAENFYRMWRLGVNYQFPLVYPDWGFGGILYFLRLRSNLFFDYTEVQDFFTSQSPYSGRFRSAGIELFFDTKWWNQLPLSFGIRYSRLFDPDFGGRAPDQFEFVLPLTLLSK